MSCVHQKLAKSSLDVTPTTLQLVVVIYSFQIRFASLPRCWEWFSRIHFQLKKNIFAPMTLNFILFDVWTWPTNLTQIRLRRITVPLPCIYVRSHFVRKLSSRHAQTNTTGRLHYTATQLQCHGSSRGPSEPLALLLFLLLGSRRFSNVQEFPTQWRLWLWWWRRCTTTAWIDSACRSVAFWLLAQCFRTVRHFWFLLLFACTFVTRATLC